jgi:hypothetical protein
LIDLPQVVEFYRQLSSACPIKSGSNERDDVVEASIRDIAKKFHDANSAKEACHSKKTALQDEWLSSRTQQQVKVSKVFLLSLV